MIKKYNQFIKENLYIDLAETHGSLGDYIETLKDDIAPDDWAQYLRIVGKYVENLDVNMDVQLANVVNLLHPYDQRLLVKELRGEFNINEQLITELVQAEQEDIADEVKNDLKEWTPAGYGGFSSFLKVISAMGVKDIKSALESPNDFYTIYIMKTLDNTKLEKTLSRFKSLKWGNKLIKKYFYKDLDIYYGIKWTGKKFNLEYGFIVDQDERHPVGEFGFTDATITKLKAVKSNSLKSLQDDIKYTSKQMKLAMRIKLELLNFEPGKYVKKSAVTIKDDVIELAYQGLGFWNSGEFEDDIEDYKDDFKDWVNSKKWGGLVMVSVIPDKMWMHFKVKVK